MTRVVVPVRFPLTEHSRQTLAAAIDITEAQEDGELTVLHVNPYQTETRVTRTDLKRAVERSFGSLPHVRYVVRRGFLVEQSILEEVASQDADVVVIGDKQISRWRRSLRRLLGEPDIESFLRRELDCDLRIV
ncbi:MAG: universal stress protein [Halodesulfurarchaeum sp.]